MIMIPSMKDHDAARDIDRYLYVSEYLDMI